MQLAVGERKRNNFLDFDEIDFFFNTQVLRIFIKFFFPFYLMTLLQILLVALLIEK